MKKLKNKKLISLIIQQIPDHIVYEKLSGQTLPLGEAFMIELEQDLLSIRDRSSETNEKISNDDLIPEFRSIESPTALNYASAILPLVNLVYIYDLISNRNIYGNSEIYRLFGYDCKLLAQPQLDWFQSILHPDDAERMGEHYESITHLKKDEYAEVDYRIYDAAGRLHWLRSRDLLLARNNKGEATHVIGTVEVITNQKIAESALIESQSLYTDLVSNQSAGIYRILIQKQKEGKSILELASIEFVSDRFCELLEVDKAAFLEDATTIIFKRLHPDDVQDFIRSNEIAQQRHESYIWEGRLLIANGIKWLRFESSPRSREDGSICWTGIAIDITKEKLAEEAIRANEEKHRMLLELATDAFFHTEKDGNLISTNSAAIAQTGYSRDELLKMNMKDFFSEDTLLEKPIKHEQLSSGEIVTTERELTCKSGKCIIVEMNSRMMPDGTYQSFYRDITDRKLHEAALNRKLVSMEIYYELAVRRERKIISLKSEINSLLERLGEKLKY